MSSIRLSDLISEPFQDALEAIQGFRGNVESKAINPEAPMAIALITDKIIMNSNLKPVTNPISFGAGNIATEDGLFSEEIFGRLPEERQRQFAYIDLHEKVFHPYVYEVLKFMLPKRLEKCASGQGAWIISKEGELLEIKDKDDPLYNEDNSGLRWIIDNFKKMKFKDTGSMIRSDRIKLLEDLTDDEIFISKWLVIPVIYRDVDMKSANKKVPLLNEYYQNVIKYSNSLRDSTFSFFNNQIRYNLQNALVEIRKFGQSLIEKKHGFFHRSILGKSIDRGSRDVISVPIMTGFERPEDNPIDILHIGIPLAKCLIIGYEFVMRYCLQFFADNFRNMKEYPVYRYDKAKGEYVISKSVKIKDQIEKFSSDYIEKKINRFKNSHGTRFEIITIETEDGKEIPMHLSGQFAPMADTRIRSSTILNRPMTWTDLFYLAAENMLSDKYCYITRYPITSHSSIFPCQCRVLSTIKTIPAYIDNQFYKYYPIIDLNTPTDRISNLFNDTLTMSNLYLQALGGDYDGDTCSVKMCFSIESNQEAKEISESIKNFISPNGGMLRTVSNEAFLTFYNMTRAEPAGGILSNELKKELLAIKPEDLTISKIAKWFGNTTSGSIKSNVKKSAFDTKGPKFNPQAKVTLQAGEYINKETITTTVGRILFNKLLVEGLVDNVVPGGFYNEECNKKKVNALFDIVAKGVMNKEISINPSLIKFVNAYEFWGLGLVAIFGTSYSMSMIVPNPQLKKEKEKLLASAKDKKLATLSNIEKQLVDRADELTEGDPGKFLFKSGARGSFGNDYKNMIVSVGVTENPITGDFDFMQSSYMEGLSKEDLPAAANSVVNAEYPKAIGTSVGGYMSKSMYSVYQSMNLGEEGTDCGTNVGMTAIITKDNLNDFIDQYLMDGKKLVLIDENLPTSYMNHPVKIRSPLYCLTKDICSKCAGQRFYKTGITTVGLVTPALAGSVQNAQLKKRHDLSIKLDLIDEKQVLL